ncbi:MAG: hypothetical protein ACK4FZ_06750 [Vogesella sp.]|uniref:hypothetical protein n=1 Tax=Vogesella sp. TaxID=1904252 RepID=UPI00391B5CA1
MKKTLYASLLLLLLTACSKGIDKTPDTSSLDVYKVRIEQDFAEATPEQVAAFNYAVSGLDFDTLKAKYKGSSYRDIASRELQAHLAGLEAQWQAVEKQKPQLLKTKADFARVQVSVLSSEITHDSFFDKWDVRYTMKVRNGSSIPLSKVKLHATLGINGQPEVLYTFEPLAEFQNGLRPGQEATITGSMVGFLSFDKPVTLAVREAQSREIVAQVLDATDFAGKWVIGNDTAMDKLETLPPQIATTKQHLASL